MFFKKIRKTIYEQDPSIHSLFESYFHPWFRAFIYYKISHYFYLRKHYSLARWISMKAKKKTGMEIHPGAMIGENVFIDHGLGVVIGETAVIKNNVTIFQNVTLGGRGSSKGKRHPTIEEGCLIGAGAKILGNITIGKNSKVGANAVVLHDVPSNTTVVGIPARVIKSRFNHSKKKTTPYK